MLSCRKTQPRRRERGKVCRVLANRIGLAAAPEIIYPQIPAFYPAQLMHRVNEGQAVCLCVRIVLVAAGSYHSNVARSLVLCSRSQRPRRRPAH